MNAVNELNGGQVAAYLRDHPDFLVDNADILDSLSLPARTGGAGVVDLQTHMLDRLRAEVDRLRTTAEDLIQTSRVNLSIQTRTLSAALALLNTLTPIHFMQLIRQDLPLFLDIDACVVALENEHPLIAGTAPVPALSALDPVWLESHRVDAVLGEMDDVWLISDYKDTFRLFGKTGPLIRSAALIRLRPGAVMPAGLLALGSRSQSTFNPGQATDLVTFLARVTEKCLYGFFEPADHSEPEG